MRARLALPFALTALVLLPAGARAATVSLTFVAPKSTQSGFFELTLLAPR